MGNWATREFSYQTEASFGVYAATAAFDTRIAVTDIRPEFTWPRMDDMSIQTHQDETRPGFLGVREGWLEFDMLAGGHGADPAAGALKPPLDGVWEFPGDPVEAFDDDLVVFYSDFEIEHGNFP